MHWSQLLGVLIGVGCLSGCELLVTFESVPDGTSGSAGAGGTASSTTAGGGNETTGGGGTTTTTTSSGPVCGNGETEAGEECDDDNDVGGDGCLDCKLDCGCPGCAAGTACPGCGQDAGSVTYKDPDTGHCYLFIPTPTAWPDSRAKCESWGGDLAALSTAAEMAELVAPDIVTVFVGGDVNGRCWLGGNDLAMEAAYVWSNGEAWSLPPAGPAWLVGEPTGGTASNCLLTGADGTLRDRACSEVFPFLCERSP